MTLGEGKKKVYMLIDEYSSGGAVTEDEDIETKMAAFFDIAQTAGNSRKSSLHRTDCGLTASRAAAAILSSPER